MLTIVVEAETVGWPKFIKGWRLDMLASLGTVRMQFRDPTGFVIM